MKTVAKLKSLMTVYGDAKAHLKQNIAIQQSTSNIPCKANKIVVYVYAFFGEL